MLIVWQTLTVDSGDGEAQYGCVADPDQRKWGSTTNERGMFIVWQTLTMDGQWGSTTLGKFHAYCVTDPDYGWIVGQHNIVVWQPLTLEVGKHNTWKNGMFIVWQTLTMDGQQVSTMVDPDFRSGEA